MSSDVEDDDQRVMTPYWALAASLGLPYAPAAKMHGVTFRTVRRWALGEEPTPAWAMDQLRELARTVEESVVETLKVIEAMPAGEVFELGYPDTDEEAEAVGLPSSQVWSFLVGRVIALTERPIVFLTRAELREREVRRAITDSQRIVLFPGSVTPN